MEYGIYAISLISCISATVTMVYYVVEQKKLQLPVVPTERDRFLAAARAEVEAIDRSVMQPELLFEKPKPKPVNTFKNCSFNNSHKWRIVLDEIPMATYVGPEGAPPLEEVRMMKYHLELIEHKNREFENYLAIEEFNQAKPVGYIRRRGTGSGGPC